MITHLWDSLFHVTFSRIITMFGVRFFCQRLQECPIFALSSNCIGNLFYAYDNVYGFFNDAYFYQNFHFYYSFLASDDGYETLMLKEYALVISGIIYSSIFAAIMIIITILIFNSDRLLVGKLQKNKKKR